MPTALALHPRNPHHVPAEELHHVPAEEHPSIPPDPTWTLRLAPDTTPAKSIHLQLTQDDLPNFLEPMTDQMPLDMTAMLIMLIIHLRAAIEPRTAHPPEIVNLAQNLLFMDVPR